MSENAQKTLNLDYYEWAAVLRSNLQRMDNYILNNVDLGSPYFGNIADPVSIKSTLDQIDKMKAMVLAWGASAQSLARQYQQQPSSPSQNGSDDTAQTHFTPVKPEKRKPGRPKKDERRRNNPSPPN